MTNIAGTCALCVLMCEVSGRVNLCVALSILFFVLMCDVMVRSVISDVDQTGWDNTKISYRSVKVVRR